MPPTTRRPASRPRSTAQPAARPGVRSGDWAQVQFAVVDAAGRRRPSAGARRHPRCARCRTRSGSRSWLAGRRRARRLRRRLHAGRRRSRSDRSRMLVAGPPRSGCSTVLLTVLAQSAQCAVVASARSPLARGGTRESAPGGDHRRRPSRHRPPARRRRPPRHRHRTRRCDRGLGRRRCHRSRCGGRRSRGCRGARLPRPHRPTPRAVVRHRCSVREPSDGDDPRHRPAADPRSSARRTRRPRAGSPLGTRRRAGPDPGGACRDAVSPCAGRCDRSAARTSP